MCGDTPKEVNVWGHTVIGLSPINVRCMGTHLYTRGRGTHLYYKESLWGKRNVPE